MLLSRHKHFPASERLVGQKALTIFLFLALLCIGIGFGYGISINPLGPLFFLSGILYVVVLIKRPEIGLVLSILIIVDCFSFLNPFLLRIPYVFRIRDLAFSVLFIPLVREAVKRRNLGYIIESPISKALILFMAVAVFTGIYSILNYKTPIVLVIMVGRRYLYYAIFFVVLYNIRTKKQVDFLIKAFFWIVVIFSILYVVQFLVGNTVKIFPYPTMIHTSEMGGTVAVTRSYVSGKRFPAFILCSTLGVLVYSEIKKKKSLLYFASLLFVIQTMLVFGRAHYLGILSGIVLTFILASLVSSRKTKVIRKSIFYAILVILPFFLAEIFAAYVSIPALSAVQERFRSTFTDFFQLSGTFGQRYEWMIGYLGLIKKNPFLGLGFLHQEYAYLLSNLPRGHVRDSHVGLLNIPIDMGIIGSIAFVILVVALLKRAFFIFRRINNSLYKGIVFGFIAVFFSRLFAFTLDDFSNYEGIAYLSLMMATMEVMYRVDQKGRES